LQNQIAEFARVCSYDRAGLGWSDPSPRSLTFDDQVGDLEHLLHKAKVAGPYLFVPESFGSLIVIRFAQHHSNEVAGVVFLDGVDPQLWFRAMADQSGISSRLKNKIIELAWRVGAVRLAFPFLAPDWVWRLPDSVKESLIAIYSRPSPGYAEALAAYDISPKKNRPLIEPGAFGNRPVVVLGHGRVSDALSNEFEKGWAASQGRLTAWSLDGQRVTIETASHELAQEQPALGAQWVRMALSRVR
jgi:pimeloyl-ACP methyl ester carboxylesterase